MDQSTQGGINIAIEGCFHGCADEVYGTIKAIEKSKNIKIDLLLICGDVQTFRNKHDMYNMACPIKYLSMGSFYKYYTGEKIAPCLTIFIGGNHEASNYLREMYFGGWVAPQIYYLGNSNVLKIRKGKTSFTLGGISGIFKIFDFNNPKMEEMPFNSDTIRAAYHTKQLEIFKFQLYSGQIDIFLSHDWPQSIHYHGNTKELLQKKRHFQDDIKSDRLGSPPLKLLLKQLKPRYWFAAHMHVKFEAVVKHAGGQNLNTKFLSLDKCLPGREFLQVFQYQEDGNVLFDQFDHNLEKTYLEYDPEWLGVISSSYKLHTIWDKLPKLFIFDNHLKDYRLSNQDKYLEFKNEKIEKEKQFMNKNLLVPENFEITALPYHEGDTTSFLTKLDKISLNNQMKLYLQMFNESGQELNGFIYYDPNQPRILLQIEPKQKIQENEIIHDNTGNRSPSVDMLDIQEFPFL